MTRTEIVEELKRLRALTPSQQDVANFNERLRTMQQIGAYFMRHGRLDEIIAELETTG